MDSNIILSGNVMEQLGKIPDGIVQTCITSPPYWGLRDYKIPPQIWDGDAKCEHEWGNEMKTVNSGGGWFDPEKRENYPTMRLHDPKKEKTNDVSQGNFCQHCNAWRGSLGLEPTPELFVQHIVQVFREVRRVLRDDGTIWVNLGDSYSGSWGASGHTEETKNFGRTTVSYGATAKGEKTTPNCKPKDLVGIPWMVAFALRADGWYLRSDIIWHKPNPMPESVTDRPTKSHEYFFLLSKSGTTQLWRHQVSREWSYEYLEDFWWKNVQTKAMEKEHPEDFENKHKWKKVNLWRGYDYYYDADAIKEPITQSSIARIGRDVENQEGSDRVPGKTNGKMKAVAARPNGIVRNRELGYDSKENNMRSHKNLLDKGQSPNGMHIRRSEGLMDLPTAERNKRTVWTVATQPYKEAHFATYPEALITPCILAGAPVGGIVLDPFFGSGTTGACAKRFGRDYIGIELSEEYIKLAERRIAKVPENLFA